MLVFDFLILLTQAIFNIKGARFASIIARTPVKMRSTNNPFKGAEIFKVSQYTFHLNVSYRTAVRNAGKRVGSEAATNFDPCPVGWAEHQHTNILVHKSNGNTYFCGVLNSSRVEKYVFANGIALNDEQINTVKQFIPPYENKAASQGLPDEEEVKFRYLNFENIISFKCGKYKFAL